MTHRVFEDLLTIMQVRDRQMLASFLRCFDASVDTISHKLAKTFKHGSMDAASKPISHNQGNPVARHPAVSNEPISVPKPLDTAIENNRQFINAVVRFISDEPYDDVDLDDVIEAVDVMDVGIVDAFFSDTLWNTIEFILHHDASMLFIDIEEMREFLIRYEYVIIDDNGRDQYDNDWSDVNITWEDLLNDEDPVRFLHSYILFMNQERNTHGNATALANIIRSEINNAFEEINENIWLDQLE